ncbi:MAG: conjugal transfer protein TraN [Gammaproteobacteria bacterium]|nr:conjugal transfer protein TraN [Gammaproteobacteria bacterium]
MNEWIQNLKNDVQNEVFMANLGQSEEYLNLMEQKDLNNSFLGETSTKNLVSNAEKLHNGNAINNYLNQEHPKTDNSTVPQEFGEMIQLNFLNGPKYIINPNEPILLHASNLQKQPFADQILISGNDYEEYQCEESVHQFTETVKEMLIIDFEKAIEKSQSVSLYAAAKNEFSVNISANLITGEITSQGNGANLLHPDSKVVNPLGQIPSGGHVEFRRTIPYSFWNGLTESVQTTISSEPSKENGYQFTFGLAQQNCNNKHKALCNQFRGMQHHWEAIIYIPPKYKNEYWKGTEKIQPFIEKEWCQIISSRCLGNSHFRNFGQGESALKIHKDCWERETTYQCGIGSKPLQDCHHLKNKGCEQVSSVCKKFHDNVCAIYEQQYRCPINTVLTVEEAKFDLEGLSQAAPQLKFEENQDFGEAISGLSLTDAFVKEQVAREGITGNFFGGQPSECETLPTQCCAQRGIVKKLFGCTEKEEELAPKVHNGLCHLIEETKNGIWHHKKRHYCCFHSKLGRIVQVGARQQLGLDFGNAEIPNCRALNADEIQNVDWSRVDFSEIIQDFNKKASASKLSSHFQNNISQKTVSQQKIEEKELLSVLDHKINDFKAVSSAPLNEYYLDKDNGELHD